MRKSCKAPGDPISAQLFIRPEAIELGSRVPTRRAVRARRRRRVGARTIRLEVARGGPAASCGPDLGRVNGDAPGPNSVGARRACPLPTHT
jgi:hypothetical protein